MRNYKFRAWDIENKIMVYSSDPEFCFMIDSVGRMLVFAIDGEDMYDLHVSEPEQYTGYKDAAGDEIYDGDILRKEHMPDVKIEFEENGFIVRNFDKARSHNDMRHNGVLNSWYREFLGTRTIIGNIRDKGDSGE